MFFFVPTLLLVLWTWNQYSRVNPALSLLFIVILAEGFYRINTFGLGSRLVGDVALLLITFTVLINFNKILTWRNRKQTAYDRVILLFWMSICASIYFGSYTVFQQPLTYGLIPARKYLLFGVYFLLIGIAFTKRDIFQFFKYLAWWGGVLALLSIVDAALGGGHIFLEYHNIGGERFGATRLAVGTFNISYSIIYCFVRLTQQKVIFKHSLPYLLLLILCLFDFFFVIMTRAAIIGLACAVVVIFIKNSKHFKVMCLVTMGIVIPLAILTYPYFEKFEILHQLNELLYSIQADTQQNTGNVSIRKEGASALLNVYWSHSPWFGIGTFSADRFPNNPITILSYFYRYHISDINGLSTLIQFGLPGISILFYLIFKTFSETSRITTSRLPEDVFLGKIFFALLIYILCTPTLGNLLVENMLVYTGVILYFLDVLKGRTEQA